MKVTLIDSTVNPVEKLIFTKSTRLKMSAIGLGAIMDMTADQKAEELNYMVNTIKSSWEFVNYTFMIEGVSRAFTHQFVRNRQGSYAQQTMRILDVNGFDYVTGPSIEGNGELELMYHNTMKYIDLMYQNLIDAGAEIEDARGILPTNICTNIVAQYNLRTMSELVASRSSSRTQGEFRNVMEAMYQEIIAIHPWAEAFLHDTKYDAAKLVQSFIDNRLEGTEDYIPMTKAVDILRK